MSTGGCIVSAINKTYGALSATRILNPHSQINYQKTH